MRLNKYGRDGRIRTCDILIPNQALYQAELHPVYENQMLDTAQQTTIQYCTLLSYLAQHDIIREVVGMVGVEPTRYFYQGILSPSRLPFRHIPITGGSYQIRTGDHRVAVYCLTTWLRNRVE